MRNVNAGPTISRYNEMMMKRITRETMMMSM
jgi:hypothetical protein